MVTLPFVPGRVQWLVGNRMWCRLGDVSYAFFLFHFLVIWSVLRVVDVPRNYTLTSTIELAALVLPITFTTAWAATRWVERPPLTEKPAQDLRRNVSTITDAVIVERRLRQGDGRSAPSRPVPARLRGRASSRTRPGDGPRP